MSPEPDGVLQVCRVIFSLNRKIYYGILALCGLFMIAFGLYLGSAPFLHPLA